MKQYFFAPSATASRSATYSSSLTFLSKSSKSIQLLLSLIVLKISLLLHEGKIGTVFIFCLLYGIKIGYSSSLTLTSKSSKVEQLLL